MFTVLYIAQQPVQLRPIRCGSTHAFIDVDNITPSFLKCVYLKINVLFIGGNTRITSFHFDAAFMNDWRLDSDWLVKTLQKGPVLRMRGIQVHEVFWRVDHEYFSIRESP